MKHLKTKILSIGIALTLTATGFYTINSLKAEDSTREQEFVQTSYHRIPLGKDVQDYVKQLCQEYGVPEKIVYAIVQTESNFQADAISITHDYGLMQINAINHRWLSQELGITDFLDAKQNLKAGIYMLSQHIQQTQTLEQALMAYGLGIGNASMLFKQGVYSTQHTRYLLQIADGIEVFDVE